MVNEVKGPVLGKKPYMFPEVFCQIIVSEFGHETWTVKPPTDTRFVVFKTWLYIPALS